MLVVIGENTWDMGASMLETTKALAKASLMAKHDYFIYAAQRDNSTIMMKKHYINENVLMYNVRKLEKEGFEVFYYNKNKEDDYSLFA